MQNNKLSKINEMYSGYKEKLKAEQTLILQYLVKPIKERIVDGNKIIEALISDNEYQQSSLFVGTQHEIQFDEEDKQFLTNQLQIVELLKWRIILFKGTYLIVVQESRVLGIATANLNYITFDPDKHLSVPNKMKLFINSSMKHCAQKLDDFQQTTKKVRIKEEYIQQQFSQQNISKNFLLNESVLNMSQQQQQQQSQIVLQQQIQQPIHSDLKTITELYEGIRKWTLEGRIISKSEIIEYKQKKNNDESGIYFKIMILDCEQEIIAGLFYDKAVTKFYNEIELNNVYFFKNASINQEKQNISKKICFNAFSIIKESQNQSLPTSPMIKLINIEDLYQLKDISFVDICVAIQSQKQNDTTKTIYQIIDQTGSIKLNFWSQQSQNFNFQYGDIVVLKNLKYHPQYKYLSGTTQTLQLQDKEIPQYKNLYNWLIGKDLSKVMQVNNQEQQPINIQEIENYVQDLLSQNKLSSTQPKILYAYIMEIKHYNIIYPSCPNSRCLSKMIEQPLRKTFKCSKCYIENDYPNYRYILKVVLMDETSNLQATVFDENAKKLLDINADEFRQLSEQEQRDKLLKASYVQKKIKLGIQFREYQGVIAPQYTLLDIQDIDYAQLTLNSLQVYDDHDLFNNISYIW